MVLLIDEIDRADDEFEAFLLEFLSDFQVSIPELGTVVAERRPLVVVTSNRTRELHDALKRRCLYHWIDYPGVEREAEIVRARLPGVPDEIAARVCGAVARLRGEELYKLPGVGETIAWAQALLALEDADLDETLGVVLKVREDIDACARAGGAAGCVSTKRPGWGGTFEAASASGSPAGWLCSPHPCALAAPASASTSSWVPTAPCAPSIPPTARPPTSH